jgi:site-specific DNA-adenine methylase
MDEGFGMPYMGSKSKIAESIVNTLPNGTRLVDLFGGGGAITCCSLYLHKYKKVLYNEFNPLCEKLFEDAINGKYNEKIFTPKFITRQEFNNHKNDDGYIKYICSFGNKGSAYMYSDENEKIKHIAHDYVVFNKWNDYLSQFIDKKMLIGKTINDRRMEFIRLIKQKQPKMAQIQQLSRLEQLERYEKLQQLENYNLFTNIEFFCGSYEDYHYQEGDIVYCDPPYGGTTTYSDSFDYDKFLNWCASRPYEVFFSSYSTNSDKRFYIYWQEKKRVLLNKSNKCTKIETLYTNKPRKQEQYIWEQMSLF